MRCQWCLFWLLINGLNHHLSFLSDNCCWIHRLKKILSGLSLLALFLHCRSLFTLFCLRWDGFFLPEVLSVFVKSFPWILPMFQKYHSIETPMTVWWLGVSCADGMHTRNPEFIEVIAALIVTAGLVGGNLFLFMPLLKDNRIKLPNTSSQSAVGRTSHERWQWPYA